MLTEFESRLADVLGSRLPAPFTGRVRRRGAAAPTGNGPVVRLGVDAVEPLEADLGSQRPEVAPGSPDLRRVVRLAVTVGVDVEAQRTDDRLQELLGIDAVIYALEDPDMRSAALLTQPADQGFRLDWLRLATSDLGADGDVVLHVAGWFWPVGEAGEAGRQIDRALVREFRLPMRLGLAGPLEAGGPDVALDVTFGATGTLDVAAPVTTSGPFGAVALRLIDDGGGPGAGTLSGGRAGPGGARVVPVADGAASVTYAPPDGPAADHLVVAAYTRDADGGERVGLELARFDLVVGR